MKKEIAFNLDQLICLPPDQSIVGSTGGRIVQDAVLGRQKKTGLVREYGDLVIDGKLIRPCHHYAIERTEAALQAIEA